MLRLCRVITTAAALASQLVLSTAFASSQNSDARATPTQTVVTESGVPSAEVVKLRASASDSFWQRDFVAAKRKLEQLATSPLTQQQRARVLVNVAICNAQSDNWNEAIVKAREGQNLADKGSLTDIDGLVVEAKCLLVNRQIRQSREIYERVLPLAIQALGEWNVDLASIYEGLAACFVYANEPAKAEPLYRKVAQLDLLKYGQDGVQLGWSLLSLSGVERTLGNQDFATKLYKKVFWNFRHQNEERILAESKPTTEEQSALTAELRRQLYGFVGGYEDRDVGLDYIKSGIPDSASLSPTTRQHDFDNWFIERIGREEAPGLAFFDPRQKLRALIVTVHGLGLHHGAFTPFAKKVQHHGLGVVSFDVRGFGSYRNDEVYQRVDFSAIVADLQNILTALRRDYPGLPIFILGESMGGALALRVTALSPDLVDGCISSVPSGTRFQAKSAALDVAIKLLKNKSEQVDFGHRVVQQATQDKNLRSAWEDDPQARMKFSPLDLVAFQRFMNENLTYAEKIKEIPVIIFQGYSDQLVKPIGTLALYQAIGSRDKDLMFIGHAEHLIFEEGQFEQDVVDGLIAWIDKQITRISKR